MQKKIIKKYIQENNLTFFKSKEFLEKLKTNQYFLINLLYFTLSEDKYLPFTKIMWNFLEENETGLIKHDLYVYLLKQKKFPEKTVRYICIKERKLRNLNTGLLAQCGTIKAIDFLINSYNLNKHHIIEAIATSHRESQIIIIENLLSRLNDKEKNLSLNKFMTNHLEENFSHINVNELQTKDLNLVLYIFKQNKNWGNDILSNDTMKKIILFNKIENNLNSDLKRNNDTKRKILKI